MKNTEKRKNARVSTVNLLSYATVAEKGGAVKQGRGKALDIGKGGILMETQVPVEDRYILLSTRNAKDELIKIKGKVIYSREKKTNLFHTGIRFMESGEKSREVVAEMIKVFLKTKAQ